MKKDNLRKICTKERNKDMYYSKNSVYRHERATFNIGLSGRTYQFVHMGFHEEIINQSS